MPTLPLEGVRVADLTVVWAGPYATALLAHLGAEVVRVESVAIFQPLTRGFSPHPAPLSVRTGRPAWRWGFPGREVGQRPWNRVPMFNAHASNKKSMTVDLRKPQGRDAFARLVRVCDVVVENNVPETMDKLGITYQWLREQRPDIIFVRMPAFGTWGKYRSYRSLGSMVDSVLGHNTLRGYADMDPTSLTVSYAADGAAGAAAAFATLAALHHRRRTGKGQLVELALAENFLPYLTQAIMDYTMNGRVQGATGNRHPYAVQGCYRCKGEDRWAVITVFDDAQFERMCGAMGHPEWAQDPRFADALARRRHHDDLDRLIESWTSQRDHYEVFHTLQRARVPAGPVLDQRDAYNDPHLGERCFFHQASQADCGTHLYPGAPFRFSETPPGIRRGPVRLGEDNEYVYKSLLCYSDEAYQEMVRQGHVGMDYRPEAG
ncbi:MAG: CoA transferase [Chloroflexi bacterium]|nr:CoA transferase [Chloroflexota bacterium]